MGLVLACCGDGGPRRVEFVDFFAVVWWDWNPRARSFVRRKASEVAEWDGMV